MVRTYIVETPDGREVLEYFRRLYEAKYYVEKNKLNACILSIKGHDFGEGFHQYRLRFDGKKFRKERIK